MRIRTPRTAVAGLGFLIAVSAGTVAYADTSLDWFEGDNATVADPHQLSAPLKIYDAAGAVVTGGDIDEPFGAFVAADGAIAAGATHASLFVHVPSPSSAPGAWTGLQTTGTTKLDVTHPPALNGKAFAVSNSSRAITLEQIVQGYENTSTADSFTDVYELRLRDALCSRWRLGRLRLDVRQGRRDVVVRHGGTRPG
ncbi:hypothetical protein [Aeromicrobium sp. UC242_57]|uniref:hypothetical protein n=1 Tax=Aeromicrobium sp. UC242_57 TaxID=3374624 RepID=UPI0037B67EBF